MKMNLNEIRNRRGSNIIDIEEIYKKLVGIYY